MKKMYVEKKQESHKPDGINQENALIITNLFSHGLFNTEVDYKNDLCIDVLNKKTAGIGTMVKPFTILADTAEKADLPYSARYYDNLANSANSINHHIKKITIAEHLRYPILNAFITTIELLHNEFESLSDGLMNSIKSYASSFVGDMVYRFVLRIDPDTILKYLFEKIGFEQLNHLYYNANKGDEEADAEFRRLVYMVADPFISAYASESAAFMTDFLFDKLYQEVLVELNYEDFHIVCEYIKPIIFSFRNDVMTIGSDLIYSLVKYRVNSTPVQISDEYKNYCKSDDTDILF